MKDDRKQILARIRKALTVPAPQHGHVTPTVEATGRAGHVPADLIADEPPVAFQNQLPIINNGPGSTGFQHWLPPVGESWEARLDLFAANAAELKAEFLLCDDEADLSARLHAMARESGWTRIATHRGELTDAMTSQLEVERLHTDDGYNIADLEACEVGITECEALVAQTGSVLVTNRATGGRALSVLPPHHIVLARRDQLVPDLTAAIHLLQERYDGNYPTTMSFITGPSRTGDIERILVLGAHGPKRLTIFCV